MDGLSVWDGNLDKVRTTALQQLSQLPYALSVGMHEVPRESLGSNESDDTSRPTVQHS